MTFNNVKYLGAGDNAGPSDGVWRDFEFGNVRDYLFMGDDFLNFEDQVSTAEHGGYISYLDTGCTCKKLDDGWGGVARLLLDATGSDEEGAFTLIDSNQLGAILTTGPKKLWFETRIKLSSVAAISGFVGLAEENCPADSLLADDGTGINKDYVGFRILEADPDGIDAVYRTASGTEGVVKNEAQVAVAATWYKLGIYYDEKYIRYYVDGVEVGSVLASTSGVPVGEYLAPLFAFKQHAAAEKILDIDWWYFGAER